jgi:hypothetical protein
VSFSELLDAVKALPRDDLQHLLVTVQERIADTSQSDDRSRMDILSLLLNEQERHASDVALSDEELVAKYFPSGATLEVFTPFEGCEAAAALQQMLAAKKAER